MHHLKAEIFQRSTVVNIQLFLKADVRIDSGIR